MDCAHPFFIQSNQGGESTARRGGVMKRGGEKSRTAKVPVSGPPVDTGITNAMADLTISSDTKDVATEKALPTLVFCVVCTDPIRSYAVGDCGHRNTCSKCYVMGMQQYGRRSCVTCKAEFGSVVITDSESKGFREFQFDTLKVSRNFENTYFDTRQQLKFFEDLYAAACPKCSYRCRSKKDLIAHCISEHGLHFCKVCLSKRKGVVLRQQRLYTQEALRDHLKRGDAATATDGPIPAHLSCKFCNERNLYDLEDHNMHMLEKHMCCQLCRRRNIEEWVTNDKALIAHYMSAHLTCEDPACCATPMENVYDNEISFQSHLLKIHGDSIKSRQQMKNAQRVQLAFPSRPMVAASTTSASSNQSYQDISFHTDPREQNRVLMNEIRKLKGEDGFATFRNTSGEFFKGLIDANTYYDRFCEMFRGCPTIASIWTILVSSLPNPELRSELYHIHYESVQNGGGFNIGCKEGRAKKAEHPSKSKNRNNNSKQSTANLPLSDAILSETDLNREGGVPAPGSGVVERPADRSSDALGDKEATSPLDSKAHASKEQEGEEVLLDLGVVGSKGPGKKGRFKKKQVLYRL